MKTITDPVGLKTTFAYDGSGKLASITDPASRVTTITVDGNGNLTQIVDPDGAVMQFGYATPSNHRITTETNPRGKTATVLYDAFGMAEGETLFGGADTTTVEPAHANGLLAAGGLLTGPPTTDFQGSITDPDNRTTTVGFSWMGHPNKGADETGAASSTKYDRRGFPVVVSDALYRVTTYTYDSKGNVTSIARPDHIPGGSGGSGSGGSGGTSNPMTITYDDQYGVPTSVTDFLGRTTTYTLDSHGNVLRRTDPDDLYEEWTYDSAGQVLTDTDRLGAVTTYHYDSYGRLDRIDNPSGTASYNQYVTYYGTATSGSIPNPSEGAAQAFDGDAATKWLSIGASWLEYQFGSGAAYTVVEYSLTSGDDNSIYPGRAPKDWQLQGSNDGSSWTAVDARTGQSDAINKHTTTFTVASPGSYKYYRLDVTANNGNSYTQLSEVELTASITTPVSVAASHTSFGYDSAGNLTSATDELGKVWNFTYDAMGRTTSTQDPVQAAAGSTVKTSYVYDGDGNLTSVTDALSRVTTYAYDDRDRLTSMTEPVHQGTTKHTAYAYDGMNLVSVTDPLGHTTSYAYDEVNRLESVTDALNHTASYTYDLAGQLTNQFDPLGRETRYSYDAKGRPTRVWRESIFGTGLDPVATYEYDDDDNVTRVFDGLNHSVVYSYDEMNRPTKAVDPLDRITTYVYDPMGRVTAQIDPLVHVTARAYDVRGRLVSETAPSGGGTTTYTYDLASRLTSLTDPVGNVTSWTYDDAGRATTEVDPLGKVTTYAHDLVGNLTQKTDRLGRIVQYGHDADDRVTTETWLPAGGGSADNVITYTYDDAGRTTQVQDHVSKYAYGYDAADRLTSVDDDGTTGLPQVTLTYDYDAAGNRTSLDDSLGGLTSYAYDERNELASLSQSGAGVNSKRVDYAYDHAGRITSLDRYGDLTGTSKAAGTTYSYDFADQLTGLAHKTSGGATIASYAYDYDAAGRLTEEGRTWNGGSSTDALTYGYTDDGQLTGVTHANGSFANESFSYDANGNRDSAGYSTGTGNRISTDGTYTYVYDAEGNQVSRTEIATDDQTLYAWDHRNRLTEVDSQVGGVTTPLARYVYDALDRRIGLLHGPDAAAPFVAQDAATQGDWIGAHGGDGYALVGDGVDLPAYASVATSPGTQTAQWTASTSDARALRKDSGSGRQASTWYSSTQFTIDVDMTDGLVHRVGLYMVDWDSTDRSQEIELIDAATGTVLGRRTVSSFHDGVYLEWEARGHVQFRVTRLAGANAVVSAVFFDAGVAAPTVGDAGFEQVAVGSGNYAYAPTGSAWTFMSVSGAGSGVSGDGSPFTSGNPDAPEGGQVAFLQGASTITQVVSGWAAGSYAISFQAAHRGNFGTSNQTVEVTVDGVVVAEVKPAGTSYQTYTTSSFTVTAGAHTIQFLGLVDDDETVFLDAVAVVPLSAWAAAAFVAEDSTTQGDWIGSYGGDGYALANDGVDLPAYASVVLSGELTAQWTASTSDARALRKDSGSGRQASTWYSSTQFTIDVDLADGLAHRVGLYMVDWDTTGRSQRIDVVDADTGATIHSRTVSSFHDGVYLEWEVRGHVQLRVTCLAGLNAVVSGVFLDAGAGVLPDAPGRWTLYDGFDPVLDFNDAGTPTARYLNGPSAAGVDAVLAREVSGSTAWYLGDRLGTIRDLIDDSGAVIDHVDYNAYGGTEAESAPSAGDRYVSFAGLVRDITVGLNLAIYRVLDPATGRWLSEDPIGFTAGDANLGRYVGNNAVNGVDPTGLSGKYLPPGKWPKGIKRLPGDGRIRGVGRTYPIDRICTVYEDKGHTGDGKQWPDHYDVEYENADGKHKVRGRINEDGKWEPIDPQDLPDAPDAPKVDSPDPGGYTYIYGGVLILGGVLVCAATIGEDIFTLGGGIIDDPLTIGAGGGMITRGGGIILGW